MTLCFHDYIYMFFKWSRSVRFALQIYPQLSDWRSLTTRKPLASIYVKFFGQEVAFANIDKPIIDQALQVQQII